MITIKFVPFKLHPTWMVFDGETKWFFDKTNGSTHEHPKDRAYKLYNKLKNKEKDLHE